jgi:DNA-binding response OmpR family regulator
MKILVVEDDDDKRERLMQFVGERYPAVSLVYARSLQSGLRAIFGGRPDLILLDMAMKNFDLTVDEDGGRPHSFAGKEILRQMQRKRLEVPTIVVTQFDRFGEEADYVTIDELKGELEKRFKNYVGTVQYRSNIDSWKDALVDLINGVIEKGKEEV